MSQERVPAARGKARVRPKPGRGVEVRSCGRRAQRDAKPEKEYIIEIARTKNRDGWIATLDKLDVRVEASTYRGAFKGAFDAVWTAGERKPRLKLIDNVDVKLMVSARKRRVVERVQPAYNATFPPLLQAIMAQREFLRCARRAVQVLRDDGLSEEDLAEIVLSHPQHVQAWLADESRDEAERSRRDESRVAEWLLGEAMRILHDAGLLRAKEGDQ